MMRSLYSGVSGLKVHQTRMDVIGNNIANVNTVGYKAQRANFSELFYQTTQSASGPNAETGAGGQNPKQVGLGVSLAQISTDITGEGGSQYTGNGLDLKINGDTFFVVNKGGANYYTKAGNFTTDGFGNLVTGSGGSVMGYVAERDEATGDFALQTDELRPISIYSAKYSSTAPAQTTKATLSGNINSEDEKFTSKGVGFVTSDLTVYDSLGNKYTIQMRIEQDANSTTGYSMYPAKIFKGNEEVTDMTIEFAGGAETDITAVDGKTYKGVEIDFNGTTGKLEDTSPAGVNIVIKDATGAAAPAFQTEIEFDFSSLTTYGGESKLEATAGAADNSGAGKGVGTMISVGIQTDGKIAASYSNGDTVYIGQIAVAQFANAAGLEKQGDNLFASTMNSGEATYMDISAAGQDMSSGVVEMSNVDLATEFTDMIVTQRGYQANSRVITTSDTMIEELLSLKR
jgi:flagellar hook protein FlgE